MGSVFYRLKRLFAPSHSYEELPGHVSWGSSFDHLDDLSMLGNNPSVHAASHQQREWLLVDTDGGCSSVLVDKHALVLELGVHYRDLRLVDPAIPTPSPAAIFLREKAIIVNFESLRTIITKDKVFILSVPQPSKPLNCGTALSKDNFFVLDLISRVRPQASGFPLHKSSIDRHLPFELRALEAGLAAAVRTLEVEAMLLEKSTLPALQRLMQKVSRKELNTIRHSKTAVNKLITRLGRIKKELEDLLDDDQDMADLYLERREAQKQVAAERAAKHAARQGSDCTAEEEGEEDDTFPEPSGDPVHDVFHFEPSERQPGTQQGPTSLRTPFAAPSAVAEPSRMPSTMSAPSLALPSAESAPAAHLPVPQRQPSDAPPSFPTAMSAPATELPSMEKRSRKKTLHRGWQNLQDLTMLVGTLRGMGTPGAGITLEEILNPNDISGAESLLESYFIAIDYTLSRLSSLEDRIKGTEDQLNIELDHRRNELVALDLFVTAVMSGFAFVSMIGGIMGMNMKNGWEESKTAFVSITFSSIAIAAIGCGAILIWARIKRLLFIPGSH